MQKSRKVKNLLVTGGAGFIGSEFIRYLLLKDRSFDGVCVNLDALTYAGNPENLRSVEKDSRYIFEHGDIRNENLISHLCMEHEIDTIIHFAAESHVDRSILGPQAFLETNVMGTFHLLEVVRKNPQIHFHHVSTDEVYGSLGSAGYFSEQSPYQPNSPYSASKAASDHLVRAYGHTYNLSTCISNCSNNYGPYQFPEKLIPLMILNCLQGNPLPIYGKGTNVRDWLYVEDHAKALLILLRHAKSGETYNIGGESEQSNIDVVHAIINIIAEIKKTDPEELQQLITYVSDRPGHDFRYAIDCNKIKKEFGWNPSHSFAQGLRKTVQWYVNEMDLVDKMDSSSI
jgi:dTDP-glucose 4,6-dehydratase